MDHNLVENLSSLSSSPVHIFNGPFCQHGASGFWQPLLMSLPKIYRTQRNNNEAPSSLALYLNAIPSVTTHHHFRGTIPTSTQKIVHATLVTEESSSDHVICRWFGRWLVGLAGVVIFGQRMRKTEP